MKNSRKICEVNEMDVYEVASFYTMFNREKVGKFHLQICGTTPCQLRGSQQIIEACQKHLSIKNGQTTSDYMDTIQDVECLGAFANSQMVQVNGEWVYEDLIHENTAKLLQDLKMEQTRKGLRSTEMIAKGLKEEQLQWYFLIYEREQIFWKRSDMKETQPRLSKIDRKQKRKDWRKKRERLNNPKTVRGEKEKGESQNVIFNFSQGIT